jgi:geranylgeranyl diphosphate synthase type II
MQSFDERMTAYRAAIGQALEAYMARPGLLEPLAQYMRYSLITSGKLLRPSLCLAACDMLQGDLEAALPVACALEMIHSYSLIHDDLPAMDNDDFRRGKPSNHKAFGEANAILAGDGLLSYAFEVMLDALAAYPNIPGYLKALRAVAKGAGVDGMVAGQVVDLDNTAKETKSAELLRYIHAHKTGAMLRASLLAGAHIAGANAQEIEAIGDFGDLYGLLFQITDDILDVEGDFAHMGKTLGKDAQNDKLTYVNIYGLDRAKRMADETAQKARTTLNERFGEKASFFLALCDQTLTRRH